MSTFKGTIIEIREAKDVSPTFKKRQFVVENVYEGQFGEKRTPALFTLTQEKCAIIDQYKVGDKVEVFYDIESREWKDKVTGESVLKDGLKQYFMDLRVWKIEAGVEATQPETSPTPPPTGETPPVTQSPAGTPPVGQSQPAGTPSFPGENQGPPTDEEGEEPSDLPF